MHGGGARLPGYLERRSEMTRSIILTALLVALGAAGLVTSPEPAAASEQRPPPPIEILVDGGYSPARVDVTEGESVRLRFVRKDYSSCTAEVVFPSLGIRRSLPTDHPVIIELPPLEAGEVEFRCGMNMVKGKLVVHPKAHASGHAR
jgi:plastocyanin domain-containing protein